MYGKPMSRIHFSQLFRRNSEALSFSETDTAGAVDLMSRCLRVDPANRPSALQLVRECPWLRDLGDNF